METGVLEKIRSFEADIERYVDSIVQQEIFRDTLTNERHRILTDHFKLQMTKEIHDTTEKLLDAYLDDDDIIEAKEAKAEGDSEIAVALNEFEKKVAFTREYHRTYRDLPRIKYELELPDPKILLTLFSSAERYGSCLDLEPHYNKYSLFMIETNKLKIDGASGEVKPERLAYLVNEHSEGWDDRLEYFQFIPRLVSLLNSEISVYRKLLAFSTYASFVKELTDYLVSFLHRCQPLEKDRVSRVLRETELEMEGFWPALEKESASVVPYTTHSGELDGMMLDKKKSKHLSCGLVIPPPLRKHAKKFSLWPLKDIEVFLQAGPDGPPLPQLADSVEAIREVCLKEGQILALLQSLLFDQLKNTEITLLRDYSKTVEEVDMDRQRAEKEFQDSLEEVNRYCGRTLEETVQRLAQYRLKGEIQEAEEGQGEGAVEGEKDDEADLGLIGDDNEPIARWLVQLQQLDKKYICEICGGTVFHGPKAFHDHFSAERHAVGLHHLGVTQHLKMFEGISNIRAVIQLRDQINQTNGGLRKRVRSDAENEEMQDNQGKVFTSREYKQLQEKNARRKMP